MLSRKVPVESYPLSPAMRQGLVRLFGTDDPAQAVRRIVEKVKKGKDAALFDLTLKIDGISLASLEVSQEQRAKAYREIDQELVSALKLAAERIRAFHIAQKENVWHETVTGEVEQRLRPLKRVGVYVPGGTAVYPSTVLMTVIPAKVAGVKEVIMVTPPKKDGTVSAVTLVAADIAGVNRIFSIGGAQAIAALAYGTESVPAVDKICGPGNIFVVLAKKMVYGVVDIDGLHGPSEVLIVADETAKPEYCAAEILAQAEHDVLASATLVTTSRQLADRVNQEITRQLKGLSRSSIIRESLKRGIIAVVDTVDEAIELANLYGPEHLCLMMAEAASYIDEVDNTGCVVAGEKATVVLGDYIAGPSHVLPTGGTARFSSPLNILDFVKVINVIKVNDTSLEQLGRAASVVARAEGLDAHAQAIEIRLKSD